MHTLFDPQGGEQPADQVEVRTENASYKVFDMRNVDGERRHYICPKDHDICHGQDVIMHIVKPGVC